MGDVDRLIDELGRCRSDFSAFNQLVFGKNPAGKPPIHKGQLRYFLSTLMPKYNVLVCGNSWGKTELIARLHAYYCIYKEGLTLDPREAAYAPYNTLNCAYTYEVSAKEFDRLTQLRADSEVLRFLIDKVDNVKRKIYFKNGSTFTAGSTDKDGRLIEGERYSLLTLEEAGYERKLRKITENVLLPRTIVPNMVDGGKLHFIGTPKPFSDQYYYHLYRKGSSGESQRHFAMSGSVYENEFLSAEDLRRIEEDYADSPYRRQVIYGEFVADTDAPFKYEMVYSMFHEGIKRGEKFSRRKYILAFDLARKCDTTVGHVLDFTDRPFIVRVDSVELRKTRWVEVYEAVSQLCREWDAVGVVVDSTGVGDVVMERLQEMGIQVEGVYMTPKAKEQMILNLQDALSRRARVPYPYKELIGDISATSVVSYPDPDLEDELIGYRWEDSALKTDRVISLAIGVYYLANFGVTERLDVDYAANRISGPRKTGVRRGTRRRVI